MNIKYVIPSYKRYDGLLTLEYLSKAKVYVSEEDYPLYTENYSKNNFVKMPNEYQGKGKAIANNWILNKEWDEDTDAIVMLDDDIKGAKLWRFENNKIDLSEEDFYEICERSVSLAKEFGCGMFLFNRTGDRLQHNPSAPFRLHGVSNGALIGLVQNDGLRFDEKLTTSEDIDLQLQSMKKYHKVLLIERYYLDVMQWTNEGGYQSIREGRKTDKRCRDLLQKKWGNKIVRTNEKQKQDVGHSIYVGLSGI